MDCTCEELVVCTCRYSGDTADARFCMVHGVDGLLDREGRQRDAKEEAHWAERFAKRPQKG